MNKNLLLKGEKQYLANYYALQRIQKYLNSSSNDSGLQEAAARMIPKLLQ